MGKVAKGFIIGACISILIGLIFFIGAARSGGITGAREYMESGNSFGISSGDLKEWNTATRQTISVSDTDTPSLTLKLGGGKFAIVESDGTDIVIKSRKKIEISHDGTDISVKTPDHYEIFGFIANNQHEVTIEVPKGIKFADIAMEVGAGEMTCPDLICDSLTMEIGAGRIAAEKFECEEATISVGAGEIVAEDGTVGEMNVEVGMGNFVYEGVVKEDLVVDCGMGNVQMELEGKEEDYNYQVECGMGNITVGNTSYAGIGAEQEIDNGAMGDFDLECGMGNLEIRFTQE